MNQFLGFLLVLAPFVIPVFITGEVAASAFGLLFYGLLFLIHHLWEKSPSGQKAAQDAKLAREQREKEQEAELAKLNALYSFNPDTGVFTVKKRSNLLRKVIKIEDSYDVSVKHEPLKLHVGAVTVGGVTTGGTYTTGGYDYMSVGNKNGLCTFKCGENIIGTIQLSPFLLQSAKESSISVFLTEETRTINVRRATIAKGQKILNWLTTEEASPEEYSFPDAKPNSNAEPIKKHDETESPQEARTLTTEKKETTTTRKQPTKEKTKSHGVVARTVNSFFAVINVLITAVMVIGEISLITDFRGTPSAQMGVAMVFGGLATIVSIPGFGKIMFRKKYGLAQRILRWVVFAAIIAVDMLIMAVVFK